MTFVWLLAWIALVLGVHLSFTWVRDTPGHGRHVQYPDTG